MRRILKLISLLLLDQITKVIIVYLSNIRTSSSNLYPNLCGNMKLKQYSLMLIYVFLAFLLVNYIIFSDTGIRKGLMLIISGGVSNVVDILERGYVLDWINISTFTFNIADIFILYGCCKIIFNIKTSY